MVIRWTKLRIVQKPQTESKITAEEQTNLKPNTDRQQTNVAYNKRNDEEERFLKRKAIIIIIAFRFRNLE